MSEDEGRRYEGKAEARVILRDADAGKGGDNSAKKQDNPKSDWERTHSARQLVFNGLLVLFTAIYAGISFVQSCATRDAADAALKSADAAATQVAVMREQMVAQQLPHIDMVDVAWSDPLPPEENRAPRILVQFRNTGPGTAYGVIGFLDCYRVDMNPQVPSQRCDRTQQLPIQRATLGADQADDATVQLVSGDALTALRAAKAGWVSLVGWFQYCDSLRLAHANPFCWRVAKLGNFTSPFRCDDPPPPEPTPITCR